MNCIGVSRRSPQATAGKGLAQGPYVVARAGVEPTTLRLKIIVSTKAPPRRTKLGLSPLSLNPLGEINTNLPSMEHARSLDSLWIFTFTCRDDSPSWSGFMQIAVGSENHEKPRVEILPFIHLDPSNPSTIYPALCFVKNQC